MARGIVLEDRPGGALAYMGTLPDYTEAERRAMLAALRKKPAKNSGPAPPARNPPSRLDSGI